MCRISETSVYKPIFSKDKAILSNKRTNSANKLDLCIRVLVFKKLTDFC